MTVPADRPAAVQLVFGDFTLDLAAQRLTRLGVPVPLPPRYFAVLVHLAGSGGRLVGKDELMDAVWGHRAVSDSALKVAVNAVRAALREDARAPRHLETVARRGYRFVGVAVAAVAGELPVSGRGLDVSGIQPDAVPDLPRGNLPPLQPGLVGRERDLARLADALAHHRLVTLHGPGGVGKTRLALAGARQGVPPDGAWLLRLDSLTSATPLLATVARTLGLGEGAQASAQTLARAIGDLRVRLVVDNAEHLRDAVAELALALLAGAPGVQLLVTSQVPLQLEAEHLLPLSPLGLPQAGDTRPDASAAVQLLLQRARQQQPDLPFDAPAAEAAAAICRALDGLPLALELAAARVPLLGWTGVRARLDDRLSLLTRGPRDAPERHRTLRAALAWTTGLLSPAEQRVLQALSVFAGSFSVEDAVAVAGAPEAADDAPLDLLDTLRERSLMVRADGTGPGFDRDDTVRWRLFDSVRNFAAEGLRASEHEQKTLHRLLVHLTAQFTAANQRYGTTPQLVWLTALRPMLDNLRAALQRALAEPVLQPAALDLFAASTLFRVRGGWSREAQRDHAALAALDVHPTTAQGRAALDLARAQLAIVGQVLPPLLGLDAARRALDELERLGDVDGQYAALVLQANALLRLQAPVAERAAVIARARALEAADWSPLQRRQGAWAEAMLLRDQGDLGAFEERCLAYMASARALDDLQSAWVGAQGLAQVMAAQQRIAPAIDLLTPVVVEMRQRGVLRENAHVLAQSASLRVTQGIAPDTVQALHEAVELMRGEGRLWWMADALAWLPAWQGRWADAARVQAWADDLVRQRGDLRGKLWGSLRERLGRWLAAQPDADHLQAVLEASPQLDEAGVVQRVFAVAAPDVSARANPANDSPLLPPLLPAEPPAQEPSAARLC